MKKLIILDIDGTVVDSPEQKLPTERLKNAVKLVQKTYKVVAATGRPWTFAKFIIQDLDLKDPSIVAGGTQIRNPDGSVQWQCDIPDASLNQALKIIEKFEWHSLLWNDYKEEKYLDDEGVRVKDLPVDEHIHFLETIFGPEKGSLELKAQLDRVKDLTATLVVSQRPGLKDLHITNEFATKEHAVAELLKITQVDVDMTIGVGDGHNDLHLFAAVKKKIAMGNAVQELKDAADLVIGNVDDEGLAIFLEQLADDSVDLL